MWVRKAKTRKELGALAEEHAARYLASRGYRIRARNFRVGRGPEVDIIAEHREALVFVEVKSRRQAETFAAQGGESLPGSSARSCGRPATFVATRERRERVMRYDIVEVYLAAGGQRGERWNTWKARSRQGRESRAITSGFQCPEQTACTSQASRTATAIQVATHDGRGDPQHPPHLHDPHGRAGPTLRHDLRRA